MMEYVVVVLENESDFPGVTGVLGPYTLSDAERMADLTCKLLRCERGEHVQIATIERA